MYDIENQHLPGKYFFPHNFCIEEIKTHTWCLWKCDEASHTWLTKGQSEDNSVTICSWLNVNTRHPDLVILHVISSDKHAIMTGEHVERSAQMATRVKPWRGEITRRCALRVGLPERSNVKLSTVFGIRGADIVGVFVTDPVQVGGYTGWPLEWTDKYHFIMHISGAMDASPGL